MAIPNETNARLFYRCAFHRYEEAEVLFKAGYTTGSVYLAGYGVECILKALILVSATPQTRLDTLKSFRGSKAHEFEWLRSLYLLNGGARFPSETTQQFTLVSDWSTELRYTPRSVQPDEAEAFLAAAANIIKWADGRI